VPSQLYCKNSYYRRHSKVWGCFEKVVRVTT
jgi:hypothetical protein